MALSVISVSYLRGEWSHLEPLSAEAHRRSRPYAQD